MHRLSVTLPNKVVAELHFMDNYPSIGPYDYIQLARTNSLFLKPTTYQATEEKYWTVLDKNRKVFAGQIPVTFDLIIDAPSNSGWHRPYVSAVRNLHPNIPCINMVKDDKGNISAFSGTIVGWATAMRVLIVDDVFSTGKMAGKIIDRLQQYSPNPAAAFMIACPLRIPPQPPAITADDLAEMLEQMKQEDAAVSEQDQQEVSSPSEP